MVGGEGCGVGYLLGHVAFVLDVHDLQSVHRGQAYGVPCRGDDGPGAGVGEHVRDAVGRVVEVDRQVGGAGLQHPEQGDHQLGRARHGDGDEPVGPGAAGAQPAGQPLGTGVEFGVGEGGALVHDGGGVGGAGGLRGDGGGQGGRGYGAPLAVEVYVLALDEQVEGGHRACRVLGEGVQDPGEPVGEQSHGLAGDPVRVVLEAQVESAAGLDDQGQRIVHGVVEGVPGQPDRAGGVGEVRFGGIVLEHHQGVEEFAAARVPGGPLDLGEAEVLVVQQGALLLLEAFQDGAEGVDGGPVQPGGQGVDEQADHRLDAGHGGVAAGDGGAEDHVLAAGQPGQQQAPGGLDDRAEGDAVFAGAGGEPGGGALGQFDTELGGLDRPGGRGLDQAGGLVDPGEGGPPGVPGGLAVGARDAGQVAAVRGDFGQRGGLLAVEGEEFAVQDRQGPAVGHDVMEGQDQTAALLAQPDQGAAQQRRPGEVEAAGAFVGGDSLGEARADGGVLGGQVDLAPRHVEAGGDELGRAAAGELAEAGPQRGVPVEEPLGGLPQEAAVDGSGEFDHLLDDVGVVLGAVHEGVEEEALLERAERQDLGDRERVVALERGEFAGGRRVPGGGGLVLGGVGGAGDAGELGDRAVPEDVPRGQLQTGPAGQDEQLDGDDAVPAEREEVVVDGHRGHPQGACVQVAQQPLAFGARGPAGAEQAVVRDRQGGGVELAAGGDGEPVQRDEGGRDHVLGQELGRVRAQPGHQRGDVAERRRAVGVRVGLAGDVQRAERGVGAACEHRVEAAVLGVRGPGEGGPVAVPGGGLVQGLRVDAGAAGAAAVVEGAEHGQVGGEAGVGDAGDAEAGGAVRGDEVGVEGLGGTECGPPKVLCGEGRQVGAGPQHDVVPVPGQLVVVDAPLDAYVRREAVQGREVVGVDKEFALPGHGPVDRGAQGFLLLGAGTARLDGGGQRPQQPEVAHVADEQRTAGREQSGRRPQDVGEVVGAREVLDDGVDDDRVEVAGGQSGQLVCGTGVQSDPAGQFRNGIDLGAQRAYRLLGEVGADVLGAVGGDPGEQQAAADADLQDAAGPQFADPGDGRVPPLAQVGEREGQAVVHAVPAREVLLEAVGSGGGVEEFVQVLPVGHGLGGLGGGVQGRYDVSGQATVAGAVLADHDGGLVDGRVGAQHRLDLAWLDAEAADLDLAVDAAVELKAPVGLPADQVAGAVQPFAGRAERVGDEPLGGQRGPAEVAAGESGAAEVQLAHHTGGYGPQPLVEDVGAGARVGNADGHDGACRGVRVAAAEGGVGGGLGGSVGVEHHPAARVAADQFGRDALGAGQQGGGGRESHVVGHGRQQRGRQDHESDAVLVRVVGERRAGHPAVGGYDDQPAAGEQTEAQVPEGHVEAGRGELQDPAVRADPEPLALGGDQLGDARVGEHHALGAAGGAGGVDDVRRVRDRQRVGGGGVVGRVGGQLGDGLRGVEDQRRRARRQVGDDLGGGDEADRAGVVEHVGDAVGRVVGVDREVGRARLQYGDLRDDHVGGAGYGERHDLLGTGAPGDQGVRQPGGSGVEFGVGEADVRVDECHFAGAGGDLVGEHARPGERGHVVRGVVPVGEDPLPLVGAEEPEVGDRGAGPVQGVGEERGVVAEDAVHGGGLEEVGGVVRVHLPVGHGERQVQRAAFAPGRGAEADGAQQGAAAAGFGGEQA